MFDNYGVISRLAGMKKKRRENHTVPGPDWLWCLDRHDKHASDPSAFGLTSQVLGEQPVQPRQRGYPRQRAATPLWAHIPAHARGDPPPSYAPSTPVQIIYTCDQDRRG